MKKLLLTLLITLMTIGYTPVYAEEKSSLLLGGVSHHFKTTDYTNSIHNTLGGIYKDKWLLTYFENSYGEHSVAAGYAFQDRFPAINIQLYVGVIHGYDRCFGKFSEKDIRENKSKAIACPMLAPAISINTGYNWEPQFTLFGDALVLSARYNFD